MRVTLNKIIKTFEQFALDHKSIADFSSNLIQKNIANSWKYPLMLTTIGSANIVNGEIRLKFDCYFLDLPKNESEYIQKLSNTLKLTEDFQIYFNKNEDAFDFILTDDATAEPVVMAFDDNVIGWKLPVTVQVWASQNEEDVAI